MISFEDACQRLERAAWRLGAERVSLAEALDRVLASDVHADADVPPFNKSSMDGYACRAADAIAPLRVIEHIPAGHMPARAITPGTCSKIMTGAPVPEGADCVLVVEEVEPCGEGLVRFTGGQVTRNICPAGEDVRAGDRVLSAGMRLRPQRLPVLASAGCARPEVYRRPRVAVLATGSELVPPECAPGPGQIRDSNSTQIAALAREAGAAVTALGAAPDTPEALRAAWEGALAAHDVVISTGGVSMGDYDLVPGILADLGFTVHFDRVAIQPGKPVLFATKGEQACFGLSGNPVSSFLQFTLFAAPFLWRLQGESGDLARFPLLLGETFTRRNAARMGWVPVRLDGAGRARALEFHGSAHIHALTRADALIAYPPGADTLREGEIALAVLLRT